MIRRESRRFTVEVRKGQKRSSQPGSAEPTQASVQKHESDSLEDIFRRAEAALFDRSEPSADSLREPRSPVPLEESKPDPHPLAVSGNPRRILETLNEVDPLESLIAERGQPARRGRKPGSKNKPKPTTPMSKVSMPTSFEYNGRTASALLDSGNAADDAYSHATSNTALFDDNPHSEVAANIDMPGIGSRSSRPRSLIRARYVTRSEPRPGERWKRRLRGGS